MAAGTKIPASTKSAAGTKIIAGTKVAEGTNLPIGPRRQSVTCLATWCVSHHESMGPDRDRSLDLKSDTHLQPDASPTALRGPAHLKTEVRNEKYVDYLQRVVKIWDFGR